MAKNILPPKWKRDREFRRLRRQLTDAVGLVTAPVTRIWWDRVRHKRIEIADGPRPASRRVALLLIFQPNGIAESVFDTLNAIVEADYAPLVIVNGAITDADKVRLAMQAWRVMTRPNIGYDFGGYRDGIWYLRQQEIAVDALLVMNDTLWLPAGDNCFTLRQLESFEASYTALSNFVYRPGRKRNDALSGRTYASSFGFWIDGEVWRSHAFQNYWRDYPLHTTKRKVVEHGEVGFSRAMTQAGFPLVTILDHAEVFARATCASRGWQEALVAMLPVLNSPLRKAQDELLAQLARGKAEPDAAAAFLATALPQLNPWDSMVVQGLVTGQIDFVKKANLKDAGNAERFLSMLDKSGFKLNATVRREIEAVACVK